MLEWKIKKIKAFRLTCHSPHDEDYEYVICKKEDIENNMHGKLSVAKYTEIPLTDVYLNKLNCQSFINLLNTIK